MPSHRVPKDTHFLNVDLDIRSRCDLQPLIRGFGKKAHVLFVGRTGRMHVAHIELASLVRSADWAIRRFHALISSFGDSERELWNTASAKDFSIGVQAGVQPNPKDFCISTESVKAAAELGARIVFTIYAPVKHGRRQP
jgi:hypothetical protein